MGRVLVLTFLGFLVFWFLTLIIFVVNFLRPSMFFNSIVAIAQVLFFGIVPVGALSALLLNVIVARRRPNQASRKPWTAWQNPRIVVALTAYDDEESIPLAVREFREEPAVLEVVVVDNNSHDATAAAANGMGARVVRELRQGYGHACIRGLNEALGNLDANIIVLAEGDMTFCARDIHKMLPYLEDVEMVVGTRTTYELAASDSQMDWFMSWGNVFLATLIRLRYWDSRFLGRIRLTDVGCTFRVLRREALEQILGDLSVGGDYFSPHMILSALRNGLRIIEVPIKFNRRVGKSKGAGSGRRRAIRIGMHMLRVIIVERSAGPSTPSHQGFPRARWVRR